jgi:glyoxylate/hydroxypyruvate reductase A
MSLLLIAPNRDMQPWEKALHSVDSDLDIEIWPDVADPKRIQFAVTWRHPAHVLKKYPNLQAVSSMGAGVDHILQDDTVPEHLTISRVVSPSLGQQMKEYVFNTVLNYQRNTFSYLRQKHEGTWEKHRNRSPEDIPVGLMGLGALGRPIARQLAGFGYTVSGWANSQKEIEGVQTFAGQKELDTFLSQTAVLICLLPLTPETQGILDLDLLKKLKRPGYLINVARGEHLVEEDLIYALDKEWLDGACLDVFTEEPLPEKHAFWNRPNIMITPHISSITPAEDIAPQIVENYKRLLSGMELLHEVDKEKGY